MKTVGLVLGQMKQGRGSRQLLLRGLKKAREEWQLICTGHNLMKLSEARIQGSAGTGNPSSGVRNGQTPDEGEG